MSEKIVLEIPYLDKFLEFTTTFEQLRPVLERIRTQALDRARANAPIESGDFRKSIQVDFFIDDDAIILDFGSTDDPLKVIFLHEAEYKIGPGSLKEPITREGGVGNKFFTRVVDYWSDTWVDLIIDFILKSADQEFRSKTMRGHP